jgi:hypothetical protein
VSPGSGATRSDPVSTPLFAWNEPAAGDAGSAGIAKPGGGSDATGGAASGSPEAAEAAGAISLLTPESPSAMALPAGGRQSAGAGYIGAWATGTSESGAESTGNAWTGTLSGSDASGSGSDGSA